MAYFKKMAIGWRCLSFIGSAWGFKQLFAAYNAQTYGPIMGAYARKYNDHVKSDFFELQDRKREFYQIDTSQYMSYTHEDLDHGHVSYGPQPEGDAMDSSWLVAMDKFLAGKPDHGLFEHANFINYKYQFVDKSFPTQEQASALVNQF